MHNSGASAAAAPFWFRGARPVPTRHGNGDDGVHVLDRADGIAKVLVLNLDRQPGRWAQFEAEARRHRLDGGGPLLELCERVPAVDGLAAPAGSFRPGEVAGKYSLDDFYVVDPQPMLAAIEGRSAIVIDASVQEMAVAQSHLGMWKRIVEEGVTTLVVEDDAEFLPGFASRVGRLWAELPEAAAEAPRFDILYLSYRAVESGFRKAPFSDSLVRPLGGLWFLSGYVLTPSGAGKLLDALPIKGPVDQWINHQLGRLEAFAAATPLIVQRRQVRSDNSYSVMPVLQGIRASTEAGRAAVRGASDPPSDGSASTGRRRAPVFGVGLNKTGTTSLHAALTLLGYRSCHWMGEEFSAETKALIDAGGPLPFEAYTDVASVVERYDELDRRFPAAVFILTVRELDEWLASRARHVALNRAENAVSADPRHSWVDVEPVVWRTERVIHHEAVLRYFQDRPDKLLVLDICGGDGWAVLCDFLGCPVPNEPFPHVDPLAARRPGADGEVARPRVRRARTHRMPQDDFPWIAPSRDAAPPSLGPVAPGDDGGSFAPLFADRFADFDSVLWAKLEDTYWGNLAVFRPGNVSILDDGGLQLTLRREDCRDRSYTAGSIASPDEPARRFTYGRFEAELRPARAPGVLTGMFLYRYDPWQEIDLEFIGARTDQLLINVFYNPGDEGDRHNDGVHGTPLLVDLGFDAAEAFHRYAIEWDPSGMRWIVDDEVVHSRADAPTPVPHLPLRLFLNTWPVDGEHLAGRVDPARLPVHTVVRSVTVSSWIPALSGRAVEGDLLSARRVT